jgi:hypothetical protein
VAALLAEVVVIMPELADLEEAEAEDVLNPAVWPQEVQA